MRDALRLRQTIIVVGMLVLGHVSQALAQSQPQVRRTDHFAIYYQPPLGSQVDPVAREAERAYARLSLDLRHSLTREITLILLPSHRELPNGEDGAMAIIRAHGAPVDGEHILVPMTPADERDGTVTHELTHQFEIEMIPSASRVPPWVFEGLAEYERIRWTSARRAVVPVSATPAVNRLTASDRDWGRVVFAFVGDEFGTEGVRRYLAALTKVAANDDAIRAAFGISAGQFDQQFERYVAARR